MKCVRWISWLGMAGMVVVLVGGCSGKDRNGTATSEPTPEAQSSATDEGAAKPIPSPPSSETGQSEQEVAEPVVKAVTESTGSEQPPAAPPAPEPAKTGEEKAAAEEPAPVETGKPNASDEEGDAPPEGSTPEAAKEPGQEGVPEKSDGKKDVEQTPKTLPTKKGPDGVKEARGETKMLPDFPPKEEKKDVSESDSMKPLDPRDAPDRDRKLGASGKPLGNRTGGGLDGLQWIPSALAFQGPTGGNGSAQSLRLEATKTSVISGVQVVGSDVFSVVNPPSFPLQLEKGKSITIQVTCASVNAPVEATLQVLVEGKTADLRLYAEPGKE